MLKHEQKISALNENINVEKYSLNQDSLKKEKIKDLTDELKIHQKTLNDVQENLKRNK